jgi:hypothetical protein
MREISDIAKYFIVELNGEQDRIQVEEVTSSLNGMNWLVTVSYFKRVENPNELQITLGLFGNRVYKRLTIDKASRKVIGMRNWSSGREEIE